MFLIRRIPVDIYKCAQQQIWDQKGERFMDIYEFCKDVLEQNTDSIKDYFNKNSYVNRHCTNEHFDVDKSIIWIKACFLYTDISFFIACKKLWPHHPGFSFSLIYRTIYYSSRKNSLYAFYMKVKRNIITHKLSYRFDLSVRTVFMTRSRWYTELNQHRLFQSDVNMYFRIVRIGVLIFLKVTDESAVKLHLP